MEEKIDKVLLESIKRNYESCGNNGLLVSDKEIGWLIQQAELAAKHKSMLENGITIKTEEKIDEVKSFLKWMTNTYPKSKLSKKDINDMSRMTLEIFEDLEAEIDEILKQYK